MIWYYFILFFTTLLTTVFSWLPKVTTLPDFLGFPLDSSLQNGIGMFYSFINIFWMIGDVFYGMLYGLLGYFVIKMVLRLFLGHRAPSSH